ncbi:hypothetical protein ACJA3J_15145 [Halobacillus sp. SY10]|uniref:hypothetical protein n=1 Tax=Halobacillus sp. SY10 TaxID=3381356 RepID=UPI003879FE1F
MTIKESKDYQQEIHIKKHHRIEGAELLGEIDAQCKNAATNIVNGWNDGPDGARYELVNINRTNNQNEHTDTKHDPYTNKSSWDYRSLATYKILYNDLTQ